MPDLIFTGTRVPPAWWERLLTHPHAVMAVFSAVVGLMLALDWSGLYLTTITDGHDAGLALLGLCQIVGAVIVTVAVLSGRGPALQRRKRQASGWALLALGWATYATLAVLSGGALSSVIISYGLSVMGALEVAAAVVILRRARELVARADRIDRQEAA